MLGGGGGGGGGLKRYFLVDAHFALWPHLGSIHDLFLTEGFNFALIGVMSGVQTNTWGWGLFGQAGVVYSSSKLGIYSTVNNYTLSKHGI